MYFDPVTGAPAAMPQIQFPTSQTAATPVEGGFTVGDYAKKKRIAEALRAKTGQGYSQMDPVGFVEGSGGQPGQAYINYGNIISNAMQPWLESRREEKAAAAESEAMAARDEALSAANFDPRTATVEQIQALQDMGVDPGAIGAVMKRDAAGAKDNTGALSQLLQTRQGVTYAEANGMIPPGSANQYIGMIEAAEAAKQKGRGVSGGSAAPKAPTKSSILGPMYALYSTLDPKSPEANTLAEKIRSIETLDNSVAGGGGKAGTEAGNVIEFEGFQAPVVQATQTQMNKGSEDVKILSTALSTIDNTLARKDSIDKIISNKDNFGYLNQVLSGVGGSGLGGGIVGEGISALTSPLIPDEIKILQSYFVDPVAKGMTAFGGNDSVQEMNFIRSKYPNGAQSPEVAKAMWADLQNQMKRDKIRGEFQRKIAHQQQLGRLLDVDWLTMANKKIAEEGLSVDKSAASAGAPAPAGAPRSAEEAAAAVEAFLASQQNQ